MRVGWERGSEGWSGWGLNGREGVRDGVDESWMGEWEGGMEWMKVGWERGGVNVYYKVWKGNKSSLILIYVESTRGILRIFSWMQFKHHYLGLVTPTPVQHPPSFVLSNNKKRKEKLERHSNLKISVYFFRKICKN